MFKKNEKKMQKNIQLNFLKENLQNILHLKKKFINEE